MAIFVLGMHRSGTSALARLLQLAGCYGGPADGFEPADESNPTGYWERSDLHAVNERLLAAAGGAWYDVAGLDLAAVPAGVRRELDDEARRIVEEMEEHPPWVVKDPRMCALMRFWRAQVSSPVIALIYRHPAAVARSLLRRDGFPLPYGLALWQQYNRAALADTAGLHRVLVRYEDLVAAPVATTHQLLADLRAAGASGLRSLEPAEVLELIDPGLCHHRGAGEGAALWPGQRRLFAALADGSALGSEPAPLSDRSLELLAACGQLRRHHRARWKEHYGAWLAERGELVAGRDEAIRYAKSLRHALDVREAAWEEERRQLVAQRDEAVRRADARSIQGRDGSGARMDPAGSAMLGTNIYWMDFGAEGAPVDPVEAVGSMWQELGRLQFELLESRGLEPHHRLLDVGCGCLRGGVHFVDFLEAGHYFGLDVNQSLISAGRRELEARGLTAKKARLLCDPAFRFDRFGTRFDWAIAISVFSHLFANQISRCFAEVRKVLAAEGSFYFSFFEAPEPGHAEDIRQPDGYSSHLDSDPFHYSPPELSQLAAPHGLRIEILGDWNHPRNQQMAVARRTSAAAGRRDSPPGNPQL